MKNCKSVTVCFIGHISSDKGKTIAFLDRNLSFSVPVRLCYFLIVRLLFFNVTVVLGGVVQCVLPL